MVTRGTDEPRAILTNETIPIHMPEAAARKSKARPMTLIAIGGNEDRDENDLCILPRVVECSGGPKARLLVCAAATAEPEETLRAYQRVFEKIGVAEVIPMSFRAREDVQGERWIEALDRATGVFFTGGDQLRLTSVVAGTPFGDRLAQRHEQDGLPVAGTSAGAAALSATMIIRGSGGTVRRADVEMAPGLGYWRDTIVDTHFDRSGRVHRLMAVMAQNPSMLCVGIDEDTAVEITDGRRFTVLGRGVVMVFDGRVSHLNTSGVEGDDPLAMTDVAVHVLPVGYGFDLQTKRPILPDGDQPAVPSR